MKKSKAKKPKFNPLTIPANSEAINAAGYNIDSLNFMRRFDKAKILNISNTAVANLKGCQICSSLRSIIVKGSPLAETEYHRLTILIGLAPLATDIDFKKVTPEEQRTMKLIQEEAICPIFQGFVITGLSPLTLRRGDEKIVIPPEKCTTPSTLKFPELKALQTVQMIEQLSVQMHEAAIELKMDPIKKDDVDKLIEQTKQDAEKANERMKRIRENRKKMLEEKKAREEAQKEMEERKTKEIEEKRQKEIEERRARELEEKKQKEIEEKRKKELAEQKAKELEEKKKREREEQEAKKKQKALEEERKRREEKEKQEEIDENDRKEAEMRLQKELEATKKQKKSSKRDSLDLPVVEEEEQKPKAKLGKEKDVVDVDKVGCFAGRRESSDDDSAELIDFHRRSSKADKEIESDEPKKAKKENKKKKSKGKDKKKSEENKKSADDSKKEKAKQSKEDEKKATKGVDIETKKSDSSKKSSNEKKSSKEEDKKQEPLEKIVNEKKEKEEKKSDSSKKTSNEKKSSKGNEKNVPEKISNEKSEKAEKKASKDKKKSDSSKKNSDDKKFSKGEDKKAKPSSEKKEKDEKKQDPPKKVAIETEEKGKNKQSIPKNKSKDLAETFVIDAKEPFQDLSKATIDKDLQHPPKNQNAPPESPTQDEKKPQTEEELRRQRLRERLMRMKANQQAKIEERKNQEAKQQESPVEVRPAFVDESSSSDIESPPPKLPISDEDRTPPASPQEQSPPRSPLPNMSPAFRKKLALIRARNDQRKETESPQAHQQSPFTRKVQISSPVEKDSGYFDSEEDGTKVQTKKEQEKKSNRSSLEIEMGKKGRLSIDSSGSEAEFGNAQSKKKVEVKQEKKSNRSSLEIEIPKKGRLSIDSSGSEAEFGNAQSKKKVEVKKSNRSSLEIEIPKKGRLSMGSSGSEEQMQVKNSMKRDTDSSDSEKPMKSKKQPKKTEDERAKTKKSKSKFDGTDSDEGKRPTKISKKPEMPDPKRKRKMSSESSESDERNKNTKPTKLPDPKRKRLSSFEAEEQTRNTKPSKKSDMTDPRRKPQNKSESSDSESSDSDKPKKQSRLKAPSSPPSPEWRYNRDQRDFGFKRRGSSPDSLGFASRKADFDSSSGSFKDDQPEPFQIEDHEVKREPSKMTPKFAKKLQEMRKKNIEQRKKSEEMEEPKVVLKPKNIEPDESPFIQPEFEPEELTQKDAPVVKKSRIPTPQRRPKTYAFKRSDSDSFEELDLDEDVRKKPTKQKDIPKKKPQQETKPKANLAQKREQQPKPEPERKPEFQKKRPPPINTGKSKNEAPVQIGITLTKTPVKKGEGGDSQDLPKLITKPKSILGKRGTESTPGTQKSVKLMQPDEPEDVHPDPPVQYRSPVEARKHVNSRLEAIRQRNQKLKVTAEEERMNDRMARIRATLKQKLSVQIRPEFLETPEEEIEEEEDEYEEDTVDYLRSPDSPIILKKTSCDSPEYEFGSSNIDKIMARARARVQQKDEKQRQTEDFGRYNSNSSDDEVDFSHPTPIKSTRRKSAVADDPASPFSKKLLMANESGMISEFLELEAIAHNESASPHPKKKPEPEPEPEQEEKPSTESYHIEEEEEFSQEEEEDFVLPEPEEDDFELEDPYGALDESNDLGYEEEDFNYVDPCDELTPSEEGLPSDLCESSTSSRAGIIPLDDVDLSLDVPSLNMDSPGTSPRSS